MSTKKTLVVINLITSVNLLVGLVNNAAIAAIFGLTANLDSYFVALIVPMMFMSLFVDFVGKNFLPVYSKEIDINYKNASIFASTLINSITLFSIFIIVLFVLIAPSLFSVIAPGFSDPKINVSVNMFQIICPSIIFMGMATFLEYILQYNDKYSKVVAANLLSSVSMLLTMLAFNDRYAEYSLAIGYTVGQFIRVVVLVYRIQHTHFLALDFKSSAFKRVLKNTGILVGSGLVTRIKPVILRYYASMLESGSLSAYSMSQKLSSPIYQTSTIGVKMMSFSKSSKLYANGKTHQLGEFYTNVVCSVMFFIVPLTVWLGVCSDDIITLLFHRGEFDEKMHSLVLFSLYGLLPSIIFLSVCPLMSNGFYVINKISVPSILGPIDTVIYIISIIFLLDKYNIFGLSLANSIVFSFRFVVFTYCLGRFINSFSSRLVIIKLISYSVISITVFFIASLIFNEVKLEFLRVMLIFMLGILSYFIIFYVKRDKSLGYIISIARR